ncbi:MAG TPA: hypothetical protein VG223_11415 [Solirubrobacteraceae bacterium]|jgi:AcrR family transcriptional regulator|nr:hypothetical protein [Solirubrobacteraceae bacterium]
MAAVKADPAKRTYAGRTQAERTAERRAALITAAFELIARDGWSQLRIERICQLAALNKRYFYESFADLDEVIVAVLDQLAQSAIVVTLAAMEQPGELTDVVHAGIHALVHHLVDDPRRARVLFGESSPSEAAARHRTTAIQQIVIAASAQGRSVHHLQDTRDPHLDLAGALLVGGTRQAVLEWIDGLLHDDIEQFIDDLAALWLAVGDDAAERTRSRSGE